LNSSDGHQFRLSKNDPWQWVHLDSQKIEYIAWDIAKSIDRNAALLSVSYGLPQIMGENYAMAGYNSVENMYQSMSFGHTNQIMAMGAYISNNSALLTAIKNSNYRNMSSLYKGEINTAYIQGLQNYENAYRQA